VALTDDQRAMLRLLAQREQGYEDIAALMGLSVEEVRAKVSEALGEIDESGQMTAVVAAGEPEAKAAEPEMTTKPPEAAEPPPARADEEPPQEKPVKAAAPAKPTPPRPPSPATRRPSIRPPKDQRLLAAGVAGVIAVALIAVLALSRNGSSPSASTTTTSATTPPPSTNAAASNPKLTQAALSPVNGGNASGRALFGRIKKTVVLQVEANGLEPSPAGESYTVWLYRSPKLRLPLAATKVGKSGRLAAQYPLPSEVITYLASGAFDQIDISLTKNSTLAASLALAKKQKSAPNYTGTDVLRGMITGPFVKKK
jgi:outer membrane biosynthesis protein TonB